MKSIKEKRGITLIALAVTIVVILILAGVTIDVTLGDKGILNKSKEAADRINNLVKEDEAELNELLNELNETMDSNWNNNIEIPDPEPEKPTKIEDEYGNEVTIPKGFEVVEEEGTTVPEGIVIQDKDGNQFVWIPVGRVYKDASKTNYSDIQLGRYTFNTTNGTPTLVQAAYTDENSKNYEQLVAIIDSDSNACYEYATRTNPEGIASNGTDGLNAIAKDLEGFVNSVKNNGGYYLARYEASYGSGSSVEDYKPLSKVSTSTTFSTSTVGSLWNNVTQIDAAKISRNMYKNDNNVEVESDLVNSYAYDTAILFIQYMSDSNYSNRSSINSKIMNTGTTGDKICNIFDISSNCREWNTEYSSCTSTSAAGSGVLRGGYAPYDNNYSACRNNSYPKVSNNYFSFRVILYLK